MGGCVCWFFAGVIMVDTTARRSEQKSDPVRVGLSPNLAQELPLDAWEAEVWERM